MQCKNDQCHFSEKVYCPLYAPLHNMRKITLIFCYLFIIFQNFTNAQNCPRPTSDFGDNLWIVRVFQLTNLSNYRGDNQYTGANNYKGYYTQKIDARGHFGAQTTLQWAANATTRPNRATRFSINANNYGTAYDGCNVTSQYFLFTHKRKGFPRNNYELFVDVWDDRTSVYLDGREISQLAQYGNNRMSKYCLYLDENSELEVRTDNSGGDMSQLSFRIVPSTAVISAPTSVSVCLGDNLSVAVSAASSNGTNLNHLFSNSSWTVDPVSTSPVVSSGGNTHQATINTFNHGNYRLMYSGKFEECDVRKVVEVNINAPVGDTSIFGNNTWNVYGFSNKTNTPATNANYLRNNLYYYGYYTQSLQENDNFGYNTTQTSTGGWDINGRPSFSTTWQGCEMPSNDNFTFIHKRKGFPCATYSLNLSRRGDNTQVFINGVLINPINTNACNGGGCSLYLGQFDLNADTKIEVRTNELTGQAQSILEITPVTSNQLAIDNDTKTCPVKGNQWVDFYEVNGRYLGSVRGLSEEVDLGNVTMVTYIDAGGSLVPACGNVDDLTAVMQRHWVIQPTINGPGEVRLPYLDTEFSNLAERSSLSTSPNDLVSYPILSTVKLSKYSGPQNVNRSPFDNCETGGTTLHEQSNSLFRANSFHYQEFVIPGFSEFWLHGSTLLTPLPTEVTNYSISCEKGQTNVEWSAVLNNSITAVVVDRSIDGQQWDEVFYFNNVKQGTYTKDFSFMEESSRPFYYRISSINTLNEPKVHQVLMSNCTGIENEDLITVFPNPATDKITIATNFSSIEGGGMLFLLDLYGKPLFEISINDLNALKAIEVDITDLPNGVYFVRVIDESLKIKPIKVVIQ